MRSVKNDEETRYYFEDSRRNKTQFVAIRSIDCKTTRNLVTTSNLFLLTHVMRVTPDREPNRLCGSAAKLNRFAEAKFTGIIWSFSSALCANPFRVDISRLHGTMEDGKSKN